MSSKFMGKSYSFFFYIQIIQIMQYKTHLIIRCSFYVYACHFLFNSSENNTIFQ